MKVPVKKETFTKDRKDPAKKKIVKIIGVYEDWMK